MRLWNPEINTSSGFVGKTQLALSGCKCSILSGFFFVPRFSFYRSGRTLIRRKFSRWSVHSRDLLEILEEIFGLCRLKRFHQFLFCRWWILLLKLDSLNSNDLGELILLLQLWCPFAAQSCIDAISCSRSRAQPLNIIKGARYETFCLTQIWLHPQSLHRC